MSVLDDAALVASLFAVDPVGTGGVWLRSQVHPAREQWLHLLPALLPSGSPVKRIPCNIADNRLLGGLDLAATLKANRPVAERGALAASDGGVVVVAMAERVSAHTAASLSAVLDAGEITLLRESLADRFPARLGVVALDEGIGEDEFVPRSLLDRLAFCLDFDGLSPHACLVPLHEGEEILAARALLPQVTVDSDILERLCGTALALGVGSPRVSLLASRVARAAAALDGRTHVVEDDAVVAGRLVLAPRATRLPPRTQEPPSRDEPPVSNQSPGPAAEPPAQSPPGDDDAGTASNSTQDPPREPDKRDEPERGLEPDTPECENKVLAASQAAIPPGLLARLKSADAMGSARASGVGRAGSHRKAMGRGRPAGVRAGTPRGNARLSVLDTLRAAAPWQTLRGRGAAADTRLRVFPEDFRITSCKQRSRTLTIFVVDASGSAALNRLAEAKGAVELLLAECYLRRDQVAVISFRGRVAELLLPPTRSLVRAKRSLAGLPGGGATPLAAAIVAAATLAIQAQRRGETPTIVLLTDGRANIARDGTPGRDAAHRDALGAAALSRQWKIQALFVDTSPRPSALAQAVATAMNARYLALPFASSRAVSAAVKAAAGSRGPL